MRRRDDHGRQRRACGDLRHPFRRSAQRRRAGHPACGLWRADARRACARGDRRLARTQEDAAGGRSGRSQRAARRTHVARRERPGGYADGDLERLRRVGRARGGLCADRRWRRLAPGREVAPAPAGPQDAGRLRGGRRDRGGVRRAADRRLLRVRADHRRLFARECGPGVRRHARRVAHHPGDQRRALRDRRARRRAR